MTAATVEPLKHIVRSQSDRMTRERRMSQLEEAKQLCDHLSAAINIAADSLQTSVPLDIQDAIALERLLSSSIESAERMNAT